MVRTPWARAARAPSTTAESGSSSCISSRSAAAMAAISPGPSAVTTPLAPGITTMALDPESSTTMCAVPLGPSAVCSKSVSTPACSRPSRSWAPYASSPTAPIIVTSPPAWAAATAWLAPLPPGTVRNSRPVTVSPRSGARAV